LRHIEKINTKTFTLYKNQQLEESAALTFYHICNPTNFFGAEPKIKTRGVIHALKLYHWL